MDALKVVEPFRQDGREETQHRFIIEKRRNGYRMKPQLRRIPRLTPPLETTRNVADSTVTVTLSEPLVNEFPALVAQPEVSTERLPNRDAKSFTKRYIDIADVPPPPEELPLIFGKYFVEGMMHWMSGETGIGKSTFLYNLVLALASGRTLWDIECKPRKILYIDMENAGFSRSKKLQELLEPNLLEGLRGRVKFLDEAVSFQEKDEFLASVQSESFDLVIFDTARTNFRVEDENSNAEFYNKVMPMLYGLKKMGIASLVVGHTSKNGDGGSRGAGGQRDAVNIDLTLKIQNGKKNESDATIALEVNKNNPLGLGISPLILRRIGGNQFERVEEPTSNQGQTDGGKVKGGKTAKCFSDVIDYLSNRTGQRTTHGEIVKDLLTRGHAEGTIKGAISKLKSKRDIVLNNDDSYSLSEADSQTEETPSQTEPRSYHEYEGANNRGCVYDENDFGDYEDRQFDEDGEIDDD